MTRREVQATLSEGGSSCRASGLLERSLCGVRADVASSRLMPWIPPSFDLERHITISSRPRTTWAWLGHVSPATMTMDAGADPQIQAGFSVKSGVEGQASVHSVKGDELGALPSGPGTRSLMWRSIGGLFQEPSGCSGRRHITGLAT